MWLTWANAVTAVRALLAFPCAWAAASQRWDLAAVLLTLAVLSDLLDGPLARRLGQTSALGGLLDHATDAAFVTMLLVALASVGYVPWLLPPLVALSFLQYVTDSQALRGKSLRASWLGRMNGIAYFMLAAVPVFRGALGLGWPPDTLIIAVGWLLVFTTTTSMLDRLWLWRTAE